MHAIAKRRSSKKGQKPRHTVELSDVRAIRTQYAISQALLARLLDVSLRTISSMESSPGKESPSQRNLTQVARLCRSLAEVVEPSFVGQWFDTPNEMLNGLKPVEAVERGQLDLVWQIVEGLRTGSPL